MKEKLTKKFYILTSIFGVLLVGIGIAGGIILGQEVFATKIDYGAIDQDGIEDNQEALMNRYKKASPSSYLTTFEPYELINISLNKLGDHQNIQKVTVGEVLAAGVKQEIRANFVKDGNNYFSESLSQSSMVKVAWRFYQDETTVNSYSGSLNNVESAKWKQDSKKDYELEAYEDTWGKTLDRGSIYVISSKTVTDGTAKEVDGNYEVSVELDVTTSVVRYVKQMMMTSNLSKPPVFHHIQLTFILDKELNVQTTTVDESYDVYMFGKHNSNGHVVDSYYYDSNAKIPQLNEDAIYDK